MAYKDNEIFSAYERYSARVPYFPQLVLLVLIFLGSVWLSLNTYVAFMRYTDAAIAIPTLVRWDWAMMLEEPFTSAAANLGMHLVGLVALAILMRVMPLFNEGHREEAGTGVGRAIDALFGGGAMAITMLYGVAFALWTIVMAVFMYIPGLLGSVFNLFLMPPAIALILGVHVFVLHSIYRVTLSDRDG